MRRSGQPPGALYGCAGNTMSVLVLSTMANSSACSAVGTAKWSSERRRSSRNACHWDSVISNSACESRIDRPVYRWGPPAAAADLFGHQVFEAGFRYAVMRLVDLGIGVQAWIVHDPLDEVIDHGGNRIDATQAFVEGHWRLLAWRFGVIERERGKPHVGELRGQLIEVAASGRVDDDSLISPGALYLADAVAESLQPPPRLRRTDVDIQLVSFRIGNGAPRDDRNPIGYQCL